MSTPDEHGSTARDAVRSLMRGGRRPDLQEKLDGPTRPRGLAYLERWFWDLHNHWRPVGMNGPERYTTTLASWASLNGHAPEPFEVTALVVLDRVGLTASQSVHQTHKARRDAETVDG